MWRNRSCRLERLVEWSKGEENKTKPAVDHGSGVRKKHEDKRSSYGGVQYVCTHKTGGPMNHLYNLQETGGEWWSAVSVQHYKRGTRETSRA